MACRSHSQLLRCCVCNRRCICPFCRWYTEKRAHCIYIFHQRLAHSEHKNIFPCSFLSQKHFQLSLKAHTILPVIDFLFQKTTNWNLTCSGLKRLKTILISVAVTQSCKTGDCSKEIADGRPSSVANAIRFPDDDTAWESVQRASWKSTKYWGKNCLISGSTILF